MAFNRLRRGDETVDLSHLLQDATGTVTITRSGRVRVMLLDVTPSEGLTSGGTMLRLDVQDRPPVRLNRGWPISVTSTTRRSGFLLPTGQLGCWAPSTADRYQLTLMWGVA